MASQEDLGSLLEEQSQLQPDDGSDASSDKDIAAEDTSKEVENQAKPKADGLPAPKGTPWVDYVPYFTHVVPETTEGRILEQMDNFNQMLAAKEVLKLAAVDQRIHNAYLKMWNMDSNNLLRCAVRFKHRHHLKFPASKK